MARNCGAPSWAALVRELLRITLEQGLEIRRPEKEEASETQRDLQTPPEGPTDSKGPDDKGASPSIYLKPSESAVTPVYKFKKEKVREYNDDQRRTAQAIIHVIDSGNASNDLLMEGANLTYELCGQDLFTLITGILYQKNRQPSEVHKSITRLANQQWVPDRQQPGFLPGWDAIVSYNFDSFMSIALEEEGVPSAA